MNFRFIKNAKAYLSAVLLVVLILGAVCFTSVGCGKDIFYQINLKTNNASYGEVVGEGRYKEGENILIKAIAKDGYIFVEWNDGEKNPIRHIKVTEDKTYTAIFQKEKYRLKTIEIYFNSLHCSASKVTVENFLLKDMYGNEFAANDAIVLYDENNGGAIFDVSNPFVCNVESNENNIFENEAQFKLTLIIACEYEEQSQTQMHGIVANDKLQTINNFTSSSWQYFDDELHNYQIVVKTNFVKA